MLFPRTATLALALLLQRSAVAGANVPGTVELDLYEVAVTCPAATDEPCTGPEGKPATPRRLVGTGFASRATSRFAGGGIRFYLELDRGDGTLLQLEIDAPPPGANQAPLISYAERGSGYSSSIARGRVEVPESAACPCQDLLFELAFSEPGLDRTWGTVDDIARRLSRGRFYTGDRACRQSERFSTLALVVEVGSTSGCRDVPSTASTDSTGEEASSAVVDLGEGCGGETEPSDEEGGCGEGDGGGSSDEGCEGDTTGSSGSASEGGCEGDGSGSSSPAGEGCSDSGSTAGGSASCDPEAHASRGGSARRGRAIGFLLPLALLGAARAASRRRGRARAARSRG
jgi:hypothetical protein